MTESKQALAPHKVARFSRKRLLINMALVLLLLALMGVLMLLLALHQPAFYVPVERRNRQVLAENANAFSEKAQRFMSAVWSEQDFDLVLTDDEVNGYLAAVNDEELWQQLNLRFTQWRQIFKSRYLRDVQVDYKPGRVTAAGQVDRFGMTFIVTISGGTKIDDEGRVRMKVTDVTAGALPIPRLLVSELLAIVDDRPIPAHAENWRVTQVDLLDGKVILHGQNVKAQAIEGR